MLLDSQETVDANGVKYDKDAKTYTAKVKSTQKQDEWQTESIKTDGIGGQKVAAQVNSAEWTITGDVAAGKVTITPAAN